MNASPRALRRPIRTVLRWQLLATAVLTLVAWMMAGEHGALSAVLGGAVSMCAGGISGVVASLGDVKSAAGTMAGALRAESVKNALIVGLLLLVLDAFAEDVVPAFFGS